MRVIIVGGTGLIGGALAESLTRDGHDVVILSRAPVRARLPRGARALQWDGRTAAGWAEAADGADAIVNLAGENLAAGRWTVERRRRIRDSRVNAGRAVVDAVDRAASPPAVVVQASAIGYYGDRGDEPLDESSTAGDGFLADVCKEWEASTAPVEARGVRRVVIRTGVVLAADQGALARMVLPFRLYIGGRIGSGRQWLSWIHLVDEVGAIRYLLADESAVGAFNLTAPTPVTNAEFARAVGRVLHRPAAVPVPALALRLALGEMSTTVLGGQRVLPRRLLQAGYRFRYPEIEAALRDLLGSRR